MLSTLPNVLEIGVPLAPPMGVDVDPRKLGEHFDKNGAPRFVLVGDMHGTFEALESVISAEGFPSGRTHYLFNGDIVDRGAFSVEVFVVLLALHICFPAYVHLVRGNHETREMAEAHSLLWEIQSKYGHEPAKDVLQLFIAAFQKMPLAAVLAHKVFVVHGGICARPGFTLAQINALARFRDPIKSPDVQDVQLFDPLQDLLWSDPSEFSGVEFNSARQISIRYSEAAVREFLRACGDLQYMVRSHVCVPEGVSEMHGGLTITVFSVPNYQEASRAAYLVFFQQAPPGIDIAALEEALSFEFPEPWRPSKDFRPPMTPPPPDPTFNAFDNDQPLVRVTKRFSSSKHAALAAQTATHPGMRTESEMFRLQCAGFDRLLGLF